MELQYTKIEYTINDTARREMGHDMKYNVTFENHV